MMRILRLILLAEAVWSLRPCVLFRNDRAATCRAVCGPAAPSGLRYKDADEIHQAQAREHDGSESASLFYKWWRKPRQSSRINAVNCDGAGGRLRVPNAGRREMQQGLQAAASTDRASKLFFFNRNSASLGSSDLGEAEAEEQGERPRPLRFFFFSSVKVVQVERGPSS